MQNIPVKLVPSNLLSSSDLIIDAIYEGGPQANAAADPKFFKGSEIRGDFVPLAEVRTRSTLSSTRVVKKKTGRILWT